MYFSWDGPINEEFLSKITEIINATTPDEVTYFYFSSTGGNVPIALAAIDMINRCDNPIGIIAYSELFSSAFHIFFKARCGKALIETCVGGIHQRYGNIRVNSDGKIKPEDDSVGSFRKQGEKYAREDYVWLKGLGLTEEELEDFKRGKDLFFNYNQLSKILNYQIKQENESEKQSKRPNTRTRGVPPKSSGRRTKGKVQ